MRSMVAPIVPVAARVNIRVCVCLPTMMVCVSVTAAYVSLPLCEAVMVAVPVVKSTSLPASAPVPMAATASLSLAKVTGRPASEVAVRVGFSPTVPVLASMNVRVCVSLMSLSYAPRSTPAPCTRAAPAASVLRSSSVLSGVPLLRKSGLPASIAGEPAARRRKSAAVGSVLANTTAASASPSVPVSVIFEEPELL